MSCLITYPANNIPADLRKPLADACDPLYLPMRLLRPRELDNSERQAIVNADIVIVTSRFALGIFLTHYAHLWHRLHPQGALLVISQKMSRYAVSHGVASTVVPKAENRISLLATLGDLRHGIETRSVVFLSGNERLPCARKLPGYVQPIPVYDNVWDANMSRKARLHITEHVASHGPITKVIVTSPSAYRRLNALRGTVTRCFCSPVFYTLGPSTANAVRADGRKVIQPAVRKDVLRRTILNMLADEKQHSPLFDDRSETEKRRGIQHNM